MANPQDPGTFEGWITHRITFEDVPPASGDTGDFERWITGRIYWQDYVAAAAAPPTRIPRHPAAYYGGPTIF